MITAAPPSAETSAARRFTLWAADRLGVEVGQDEQGGFWLEVPLEARDAFDGAERVHFTFDREVYAESKDRELELAAPGSRLLSWLIGRVRELGNVAHAAPADQPASVHEISGRLFSAYQLDGGTARLAGCSLDDHLVLRFTYRLRLEGLEPRDELIDVFLADDGTELSPQRQQELGVNQILPMERTPRVSESQLEWLVEAGEQAGQRRRQRAQEEAAAELLPRKQEEQRQLTEYFAKTRAEIADELGEKTTSEERAAIQEQLRSLDAQRERRLAALEERYSVQADMELVATTLIWCKRASGKLRFSFADQTTDVSFNDWARTLAAPPFVCPHTGTGSMHLAVTDDGRITAAGEIEPCQRTGRRVLRKELITCSLTGQRVLPEFVSTCPVTEAPVLTEALVACGECRQKVSPRTIDKGRCRACRTREGIKPADARLARVFIEYPLLERWRNWSLSETSTVYNLTAAGLVKRLLVVIDKQSFAVLHLATGHRLSSTWTAVDPAQMDNAAQ